MAADRQFLPGDGEHIQGQDIVHGQPVFEAVHAAGIFRHIAADGAGDLGRGIGAIIQAVAGGCFGDGQIADAGLYAGGARQRVDIEYAIELAQDQQDAVRVRHGPGAQAGAGTPGDHRDIAFDGKYAAPAAPVPQFRAAPPPAADRGRGSVHRTRKDAAIRAPR